MLLPVPICPPSPTAPYADSHDQGRIEQEMAFTQLKLQTSLLLSTSSPFYTLFRSEFHCSVDIALILAQWLCGRYEMAVLAPPPPPIHMEDRRP